jgi:hypothetical protein
MGGFPGQCWLFHHDYFLLPFTIVEKKSRILSERAVFLMGSENRGFSLWQISPLPGQKGRRLAKKGGGSSFAGCGLPPFSAKQFLSPRVSLRKGRRMGRAG